MKISKKEKLKNKEKLLKIAIELISINGYKKTSMSKIAKKANIADATIYNYFPTKEHILYEYFYLLQIKTKDKLLKIKEFNTFSLKEQIQTLIMIELEILHSNRKFILEIYHNIFYQNFNHPELDKGNKEFNNMITELIEISIDANEIESFNFSSTLKSLFNDYFFGIIYYWIYDNSKNYDNTTIMLDKSLDIIYATLTSGIISKIEDLFSYVIKTHILSYIKPNKKFTNKTTFGK